MTDRSFECPVCGSVENKPRIEFEERGYCSAKCMSEAEFEGQKLYRVTGTVESATTDQNGQSITDHTKTKKFWAESVEDAVSQWLGKPEDDRSQWMTSVDEIKVIQE